MCPNFVKLMKDVYIPFCLKFPFWIQILWLLYKIIKVVDLPIWFSIWLQKVQRYWCMSLSEAVTTWLLWSIMRGLSLGFSFWLSSYQSTFPYRSDLYEYEKVSMPQFLTFWGGKSRCEGFIRSLNCWQITSSMNFNGKANNRSSRSLLVCFVEVK